VLLAALALDWRVASLVALGSGFLADLLFVGPPFKFLEAPSDQFGTLVFGVISCLIVGLGYVIRRAVADPLWLNVPEEVPEGVIFSQEGDQALVSWHGGRSFVPLGPHDEVAEMMQDFLAQRELGKRLTGAIDLSGAVTPSAIPPSAL
jgi:hypothetical protein